MDKQITVREATNRGNNMLMVGYLAITAAAIVERLIGEDDLVDRLDEAVIILLAIAGLVWYFSRRNRYQHSFAPLALFIGTFVVQAAGLAADGYGGGTAGRVGPAGQVPQRSGRRAEYDHD